ncbi:MAG: PD-(D/E)XK nuclease family protein, partial [Candidatus Magasanikbacteria bacterium]|nr:PD-(D/E)XK nuclease family protein [Candidatus Magasanikbacteria bacterium]
NLGPVGKLSFYYLTNNQSVDFVADPEDVVEWQSKMITIIDGIQSRNFTATPDKITCEHCPFNKICEFSAA